MKTLSTLLLVFAMNITLGSAKLMAQPANDLIANAINLINQPIPYNEANVNFPAATNTNDSTQGSGCTATYAAVWYKFTASKVGTVSAAILNPDEPTIIFYEGPATGVTSGAQLTYINQANNPCAIGPLANIETTIGKTYYIYMRNLIVSNIIINISDAVLPPPNDLIENAIDLGYGPIPFIDENVGFPLATNTNDHTPALGCDLSQSAVWYKFTATKAGVVGAGIVLPDSPVIVFFEGPAEGVTSGMQLEYVDQPNNTCAVGSLSSIETTPGTTYYVYAKNNVVSSFIINTANAFQVPENDLIENAIDLAQQAIPYEENNIHMLMATNTNDGGQEGCNTSAAGIWYKITTMQEGEIAALISGALGTTAGVFFSSENPNATSGTELTWIDQPNNPCGPNGEVLIQAEEGITYYLFVVSTNAYINLQIYVSPALSVPENNLIDFNFYPNPVVDQLNFSAKSSIDNIKVYNLLGQQVLNQNVNSNSGSVDLSHLAKGMYLAEITSGGTRTTAKILKK